jgi:hypothetical protein
MIVNERGEWESESDPEDEGPKYDEEIINEESEEIQPDRGDNNCFISRRVLSVALIKEKLCSIIVDNGSCNNIASQELVERLGLKQ